MASRILVVENNPYLSAMLEDYLDLLGHEAVSCGEGVSAALEELASNRIDAAIIDVYLGNGETSSPIAEALSAGSIPFLVSTAGFIAEREPAFAGRPLLMKPFTARSLCQAITELAH